MQLITTKVCLMSDIGVHGNLFGGTMLAWLDEAGAAYACQIAKSTKMVTRFISGVEFCRPVSSVDRSAGGHRGLAFQPITKP